MAPTGSLLARAPSGSAGVSDEVGRGHLDDLRCVAGVGAGRSPSAVPAQSSGSAFHHAGKQAGGLCAGRQEHPARPGSERRLARIGAELVPQRVRGDYRRGSSGELLGAGGRRPGPRRQRTTHAIGARAAASNAGRGHGADGRGGGTGRRCRRAPGGRAVSGGSRPRCGAAACQPRRSGAASRRGNALRDGAAARPALGR